MPFELQGHRGARGLKPENTLPSFEAALDAGVSTIETDLFLTRDGVPVLCHEPTLAEFVTLSPAEAAAAPELRLAHLTVAECRRFRLDRNPNPGRFPDQTNDPTPVATLFGQAQQMDPYALPTLADLFAFVAAYAGPLGEQAGKTSEQRGRAGRLRFDLELKRVPFEPEQIGDQFDGIAPGLLEQRVIDEVKRASVLARTIVRSFDHRSVRAIKTLAPSLTTAVLIADTMPVSAVNLTRDAGASIYCPDYHFVTAQMIREVQAAGLRIIPWTVNEPEVWERLAPWGVDGVTTDYPDQLAKWLTERKVDVL